MSSIGAIVAPGQDGKGGRDGTYMRRSGISLGPGPSLRCCVPHEDVVHGSVCPGNVKTISQACAGKARCAVYIHSTHH